MTGNILTLLLIVFHVCSSTFVIDSFEDGNKIVRVPLFHMKTGFERILNSGQNLTKLEELYRDSSLNKKPDIDTLPLFKHLGTEYYGLVNIGKPGKTFKMVFDTAWSYSWVISVNCPKTSLPCVFHNKYDHRVSSTYKPDGTIINLGQMSGFMSKDVFLVGQMNSTDQPFIEVTALPMENVFDTTDGIVGLGLQAGSRPYVPFFYKFFEENKLRLPIFSFYVNRDPTTEHGGSVLFGAIDPKHKKGDFTTVDTTSDTYWTFKMQKVKLVMSSKSVVEFCKNGCTATADTSTVTISGPQNEIHEINSLIGAQRFLLGRFMIPCATKFKGPRLNFTIGARDFQILARDYVQELSYSGITLCLSAFQVVDNSSAQISDWFLGGAFLYQFYTAYDLAHRKLMIADAA